jgi:hypothetical protein
MKIIAKHKDYYDNAVDASMVDDTIRYVRIPSLVKYNHSKRMPWNEPFVSKYRRGKTVDSGYHSNRISYECEHGGRVTNETLVLRLHEGVLIVAGKAYPGWLREDIEEARINPSDPTMRWYGYPDLVPEPKVYAQPNVAELSYGDVDSDAWHQVALKYFQSHPRVTGLEGKCVPHRSSETEALSFMMDDDRVEQQQAAYAKFFTEDHNDLCVHFQTPVLLILPSGVLKSSKDNPVTSSDDNVVVLNPPLKAFNFHRVMDQFACWQEISMWIGGVMPGRQSPMVEISDTSKIAKHGFDPVMGFRKRKEVTNK